MNPPHDGLAAAATHPPSAGLQAAARLPGDCSAPAIPGWPAGSGRLLYLLAIGGPEGTRAAYSDACDRFARWRAVWEPQSAGTPERASSAASMTGGHRA